MWMIQTNFKFNIDFKLKIHVSLSEVSTIFEPDAFVNEAFRDKQKLIGKPTNKNVRLCINNTNI